MLIYDHNKEFIGIDDQSLEVLGYERFDELIHEHKDIAELFVKKPGYIHNFTNFPWIDFVLHAESDDAKVIIAGKKRAVSATISISTLHLTMNPQEDGYIIALKNVQPYQLDASEKPEPSTATFELETKDFNAPADEQEKVVAPVNEAPVEIDITPDVTQQPLDIGQDLFLEEDQQPENVPEVEEQKPLILDDDMDIFFQDEEDTQEPRVEVNAEIPEPSESIFDNIKEETGTPMLGAYLSEEDKSYLAELEVSDDYIYDPQIAADELGLPVDLIEEFIGDFIKQAHEFKDQLFSAIDNQDFDSIKVLSHKLKGVAANLRIEDSFEVLKNVNESSDVKECEANLKKFYMTIGKLEGKDVEEVKRELETPEAELYDLTPKFEPEPEPFDLPNFEETPEGLDLPDFEETPENLELPDFEEENLHTAPVLDEVSTEIPEAPALENDDNDIYDYALAKPSDDEPLIIMDDEEEIISELNSFETGNEAQTGIEDFGSEDTLLQELPTLTFDINAAAADIGLSADLIGALIEDYIAEAHEMKPKLDEAISNGDTMRWKGYAIQLKGVSDNLRINEITETLQKLITSSETEDAKAALQEFYGFINQL